MSVRDLMSQLQRLDVKVWVDGDRLRVSAPEGALSPALKDEMQWRKPEIMSFLAAAAAQASFPASVVPLQPEGGKTPIFAVPGHNGDVFCYVRLAEELPHDRAFYALQPPGLDGRRPPAITIRDLARVFADDVEAFRPEGPLVIAGFCLGGATAFETACQLESRGREITMLALFGAPCPTAWKPARQMISKLKHYASRAADYAGTLITSPRKGLERVRARAQTAAGAPGSPPVVDETTRNRLTVEDVTVDAVKAYAPGTYGGAITLYHPDPTWKGSDDRPADWKKLARKGVEDRIGPPGCNGDHMLRHYAPDFARLFAADLERMRREG